MMNTKVIVGKGVMGVVVAAMALLIACAFVVPAYANTQLDAPTTVSDDVTRLKVTKLDADTHEYVSGAKMAIINEETSEVVDSWVTGTASHENSKVLDVNVVYILRELEAPSGYDKVNDVRFIVNETEGSGITILSGGDGASLTESYKVSLYDKKQPIGKEIVAEKKVNASKTVAPKTGDETPLNAVAALLVVSALLVVVLEVVKRRTTGGTRE